MNLEHLDGQDCMVRAVLSATKRHDAHELLVSERIRQMKQMPAKLDPHWEATNLSVLFQLVGEEAHIDVGTVRSLDDLRMLAATTNDLFVGFAAGTDTPPHITHLGEPTFGGFFSAQQFTSNQLITQQLMEQDQVYVFIKH